MNSNYLLLGQTPIQEDAPAGQDVRSEEAFERLQAELDKLNSPSLAAQVDWGVVEQAAAELLQHHGKDVLVACYLCYALMVRHGLPGLEAGLRVLADMHRLYWESMFPKLSRMRARKNAIEWLLEKCLPLLEAGTPLAEETYSAALIASIQEQLAQLDTALDSNMPDAPAFFKFRNQIAALNVEVVEEVAVEPEPQIQTAEVQTASPRQTADTAADNAPRAPKSSSASTQASSSQASTIAPYSAGDVEQSLTALSEYLSSLAADLRSQNDCDFRAYQLSRIAAWGNMEQVPPHSSEQTAIPAPIEQLIEALQRMQTLMLNEETIEFCENQLAEKPFWLDLQWACYNALQRLGDKHAQAAAAVEAETRLLVQRLPALLTLRFSDGSPFASPQTQEWLSTGGAVPTGSGAVASTPLAGMQAAAAAAVQAVQGNMLAAAQALQDGMRKNASVSARDKLKAKVQFAQLWLENSNSFHLKAYAEDLQALVHKHALLEWEPDLAVEVLEVCYQIHCANEDMAAAQAVLQQIAHVDLAVFAKVSGAA